MQAAAAAAEAEKIRIEEEAQRREDERIKAHRAEIERKEKLKMAAQLAAQLEEKNLNIKGDLTDIGTDALLALQQRQLEKDRKDAKQKIRMLIKRHDHSVRAMRREEMPLLEADYVRQKQQDKAYHSAMVQSTISAAQKTHAEVSKTKKRFVNMKPAYLDFVASLKKSREADYQHRLIESAKALSDAKKARMEEYNVEMEEKRVAREALEKAERIRREEQERKDAERQLLEAERREKEEKVRQESDEKRRYCCVLLSQETG